MSLCTFDSLKGTNGWCRPLKHRGRNVASHIYRDLPPAPYACVLCGRKLGDRYLKLVA